MTVCASCGTENRDEARFCDSCGAALGEAAATRELRKTVTVLFCDVTGSTELGEQLDPESLRRVMARYFAVAREVVERHGGTVEKFIGDAVMAVFGVPVVHEDDAIRAVRAAGELRDALGQLNQELVGAYGTRLDLRTGVNTGEVVTGTQERLATGDAVNVAARLEQAAQPGEILLGDETFRLVRDAVEAEPVAPLELKGKSGAVPAYRLLSVGVGDVAPNRLTVAMVGRERQRQLLDDAFANVVGERACHLFTVLGTAGVGKSRLVAEFLESLDGATVIGGRCLSYGEGISYWPVTAAVKELLGQSPEERLAELGFDAATARALDPILGEARASSPEEIAWAVRKLFEAAAAASPLVVVFDDVHWGEPVFFDLVENVADLSRDAPILLLCMARPELLDRRSAWGGGKLNATNVLLEPLSTDETGELIERLLSGQRMEDTLRGRILEAAGGNPLFVGEMLAMLSERRDDDASAEVAVPPTIQALLASRLDMLEDAERRVLERGAVEGHVFHRGAVIALAPGEGEVDSSLMKLVRKDLVRPEQSLLAGDDAYRFRHLLIRDAAYEALPKATRSELHERFADWVEVNAPSLVELDEIVGYHLEQAYSYRAELGPLDDVARGLAPRAAARLLSAAKRAHERGDIPALESLAPRAAALASAGTALRREALLQLSRMQVAVANVAGARTSIEELCTEAELAGDASMSAKAKLVEIELNNEHDRTASMSEALLRATEAENELERLGDDEGVAWAHRLVGNFLAWLGRTDEAEQRWAQALERARRAGSAGQVADILGWRAWALWWGPMPADEAIRQADAIIEQAAGYPYLEGLATVVRGCLTGFAGQPEAGRSEIAAGRTRLSDVGLVQAWAATAQILGEMELAAGEPARAEAALAESYEFMSATRATGYLSTTVGLRAAAALELGRDDEALRLADEVEAISQAGDFEPHVRQSCVRARVLARRGDHDAAAEVIEAAVAIADETDFLTLVEYAAISLAEVERLAGRGDGERAALEKALRIAEQKGDVLTADQAREQLADAAQRGAAH
jgi:class 3 adenylate cyclase